MSADTALQKAQQINVNMTRVLMPLTQQYPTLPMSTSVRSNMSCTRSLFESSLSMKNIHSSRKEQLCSVREHGSTT